MAYENLDLTSQTLESPPVVFAQDSYPDDTILNVTSNHTSWLLVSNVSRTSDVIDIQQNFIVDEGNYEQFRSFYRIEVMNSAHVRLLPVTTPLPDNAHLTYTMYGHSTLEMPPEFLSSMIAGHEMFINMSLNTFEGKQGAHLYMDTRGIEVENWNIQLDLSEHDQVTVWGATKSEYDPESRSLIFKNDDDSIVGSFLIKSRFVDPSKFNFHGDTVSYACYLKGTLISTEQGQIKVEDLKAGDKVITVSGGTAKVKWLGYRTLFKNRIPEKDARRAFPILFKKDCIANNVPQRDLIISPGHHLFIDGNLVPAMMLVNGKSIVQQFQMQSFQYFHVELEQFDILLAEGVPAESYVDTGNRNMFQNAYEVAMSPDFGPAAGRPDVPGVTVVRKGPVLDDIRAKLLERAKLMQAPEAQKRSV